MNICHHLTSAELRKGKLAFAKNVFLLHSFVLSVRVVSAPNYSYNLLFVLSVVSTPNYY